MNIVDSVDSVDNNVDTLSFLDQTTCNWCPVGYFCPDKDQDEVICPMGSFSDGALEACQVRNFEKHFEVKCCF